MTFPNAHNGVKKIFTAEILSLIAAVALIVASIVSIIGAKAIGTAQTESAKAAAFGVAGGLAVFGIASSVLMVIAYILTLVGIISAMKDEASFKTALIFAVIGLVAAGVASVFSTGVTGSIMQIVSNVANLMVTLYVVQGIVNLAAKLNDGDMVARGNKARWILTIAYCLPIIASLVASILAINKAGVAAAVIGLITALLTLVAYFIYLAYLSAAKKMLAEK